MSLAEPAWLIGLVLVLAPWLLGRWRSRLTWPTLQGFPVPGRPGRWLSGHLPNLLRAVAIACLVVAMARPRSVAGRTWIAAQGVAIVVALDQSSSMSIPEAVGPPVTSGPTRLEAAKNTLIRFITGRPDDLIGLVTFANLPFTACPLTLDHAFLIETVAATRLARPGDDGTNLGDALVWGADLLHDSAPRRKVLILLTDGRDSPGVPRPPDHPLNAARIARALGIVVHTIAIGHAGVLVHGVEPSSSVGPVVNLEGPDLELLQKVAEIGGGRSFVAADGAALSDVFSEINRLEKSPVRGEIRTRYREHYAPLIAAALALILVDRLLCAGRWRRLP